ncbi:MAG: hypothetical protein BECKG1743E_GA0114224_111382, partial [Candidatus Kentron sp. G]
HERYPADVKCLSLLYLYVGRYPRNNASRNRPSAPEGDSNGRWGGWDTDPPFSGAITEILVSPPPAPGETSAKYGASASIGEREVRRVNQIPRKTESATPSTRQTNAPTNRCRFAIVMVMPDTDILSMAEF